MGQDNSGPDRHRVYAHHASRLHYSQTADRDPLAFLDESTRRSVLRNQKFVRVSVTLGVILILGAALVGTSAVLWMNMAPSP